MFAGPNGSGKSTLKGILRPDLLGLYVNADEIEVALRSPEGFDFAAYGLDPSGKELRRFLGDSALLQKAGLIEVAAAMPFRDRRLGFGETEGNSYLAAVVADFIRREVLARGESFSFETVMSSRDKVLLFREAQRLGYRTYLYYVATEDPEINLSRIARRVRKGGHDVPGEKVLERYRRSLNLLPEAIRYSNRAYVFDNSNENSALQWIAEFTDGQDVEFRTVLIPEWFKRSVLEKISL